MIVKKTLRPIRVEALGVWSVENVLEILTLAFPVTHLSCNISVDVFA